MIFIKSLTGGIPAPSEHQETARKGGSEKMTELTKEWLQNTITGIESSRDEIPFGLDEDQNNMLTALKIALASLASVSDERAAYELFMEKRFGESVDRRRAKKWR